jgi:hypothetical protein
MNRLFAALAFCVLTSGCAQIFYSHTQTGKLEGKIDLQWVEPNYFAYIKDPSDPLTYYPPGMPAIIPQDMYTDGGSIPRVFWSIPKFGPWDYGPGYVIHDWLFENHHCGDKSISFEQSATLLSQVMKTQMEADASMRDPNVLWLVHEAVLSPIAQKVWDEGTCGTPPAAEPRVEPKSFSAPARRTKVATIACHDGKCSVQRP